MDYDVEEMLDDTSAQREPVQTELVGQYCGTVEEEIRRAATVAEARSAAERACLAFNDACESGLVKSYLTRYIDGLLRRYWKVPLE